MTNMILTLNLIKSHNPCQDGYATLLRSLNKTEADDEPLCLNHLLESNGVNDTMWVIFRCVDGREIEKRNLLADIVESVEYIWDEEYPEDKCIRNVIEELRNGGIEKEKLIELRNKVRNSISHAAAAVVNAVGYATNAANAGNAACYATDAASHAVFSCWHAKEKGVEERKKAKENERERQKGMIRKWFGDLVMEGKS